MAPAARLVREPGRLVLRPAVAEAELRRRSPAGLGAARRRRVLHRGSPRPAAGPALHGRGGRLGRARGGGERRLLAPRARWRRRRDRPQGVARGSLGRGRWGGAARVRRPRGRAGAGLLAAGDARATDPGRGVADARRHDAMARRRGQAARRGEPPVGRGRADGAGGRARQPPRRAGGPPGSRSTARPDAGRVPHRAGAARARHRRRPPPPRLGSEPDGRLSRRGARRAARVGDAGRARRGTAGRGAALADPVGHPRGGRQRDGSPARFPVRGASPGAHALHDAAVRSARADLAARGSPRNRRGGRAGDRRRSLSCSSWPDAGR